VQHQVEQEVPVLLVVMPIMPVAVEVQVVDLQRVTYLVMEVQVEL
jgi:hypothetical protein